MRYVLHPVIVCLCVLASTSAWALGKTATTSNGRTVVLYDNGNWHYAPSGNMDNETNLGGSDYRGFDLPWPDPDLCANTCGEESQCKAWTFVKSGYQGNRARCWLKGTVPRPDVNACCISGIKQEVVDVDNDYQTFSSEAGVIIKETTTASMEDTLVSFGLPDNFSKMLVAANETEGGQSVALEVWDFNGGNRAHVFLDGELQGVAELPTSKASRCPSTQHDPRSLQLGMSIFEAGNVLGIDMAVQLLREADLDGYEIIAIDGLVLGFDKERLVYADTCVTHETGGAR